MHAYSTEQIRSALQYADRMNELIAQHRAKAEKIERVKNRNTRKEEKADVAN